MCMCMHACMNACTHVCMYVCMSACLQMHEHTWARALLGVVQEENLSLSANTSEIRVAVKELLFTWLYPNIL